MAKRLRRGSVPIHPEVLLQSGINMFEHTPDAFGGISPNQTSTESNDFGPQTVAASVVINPGLDALSPALHPRPAEMT